MVAFTQNGKTVALEYKGEDRVSNEDKQYKVKIDDDWAALDPEHRLFRLVTRGSMSRCPQGGG